MQPDNLEESTRHRHQVQKAIEGLWSVCSSTGKQGNSFHPTIHGRRQNRQIRVQEVCHAFFSA